MEYNPKASRESMNLSTGNYQIQRAISKLKEAPAYKHKLQIPTAWIIETVIDELEAYLETQEISISTDVRESPES